MSARYDHIGQGYALHRREDPHLAARILAALGEARTVVNVGAGAGSYEPRGRRLLAVDPSRVMLAQRPLGQGLAVLGRAQALPLADGAVEAAMAILALHHFDEGQEEGVKELRRVATGPVVILTCDPAVSSAMWLQADYLHEVGALEHRIFPTMERLASWLGGRTEVEVVAIRRDTPDWTLMSFWAHPERVLDPKARSSTSGFALLPEAEVQRVVTALSRDLADGTWDARHGRLRQLDAYDAGLRLVVNWPSEPPATSGTGSDLRRGLDASDTGSD